jgi:hypothetical protein
VVSLSQPLTIGLHSHRELLRKEEAMAQETQVSVYRNSDTNKHAVGTREI